MPTETDELKPPLHPTSYSRASPCRFRITTQVRALPHRHLRKRPELRLPRRAAHPWLATARMRMAAATRHRLRSPPSRSLRSPLLHTFSTQLLPALSPTPSPTMRGCGICSAKSKSSSASGRCRAAYLPGDAQRRRPALHYLESRNFTEPAFVFVIMVIAASRPIIDLAGALLHLHLACTAAGAARCLLLHASFGRAAAGFVHHRAGSHDACGAAAARALLQPQCAQGHSCTPRSACCSSISRSAARSLRMPPRRC